MTYVITQPCEGVKDGACIDACPVDCIEGTPETPMLYIDPDTCIDCGLCVDECPVKAIFPEDDLPAEWQSFVEKNKAYYKK